MNIRTVLSLLGVAGLAAFGCQKEKSKDSPKAQESQTTDPGASRPKTKPGKTRGEPIPAPKDVAAPPGDAEKTASGLASKVLKPGGGGDHPTALDKVKVHYTGWTTDGNMFDSSVSRGRPATFQLKAVIPGWTEGVQLMTVGEQRRFWIPEELAYKGRPGAPQGMLVFDVELLEIIPGPKPIPAPPDVAAPPGDAKKTQSGLAYKFLTRGNGDTSPEPQDRVKVHYTGWTTDGNMFDSSVSRQRPASFAVKGVIPGWTEGLQLMKVGDKARLWIPEELAYKGKPGRPQGMLVFDVELLEITPGPKPIPAPADVAAPPKAAKKTKSGLAYLVLEKGDGKQHPTAKSRVSVHYTGWTTDGNMFDSSHTRGRPATFPLTGVIPGWTEGVQLMTVGEKTRFWIPEELAYKGKPGRPQGMLVFEIELLEIN